MVDVDVDRTFINASCVEMGAEYGSGVKKCIYKARQNPYKGYMVTQGEASAKK